MSSAFPLPARMRAGSGRLDDLCLTKRGARAIMAALEQIIGGRHGEVHARQLQDLPVGATTTKPPSRSRCLLSGSKRRSKSRAADPSFNGAKYSLVDAAYAPFLQRYYFLDRVKKLGHIEKFPRLKAWMEALLQRDSTHSFPAAEFEAMYREGLRRRNKWVSRFIEPARAAAE
jgi:glutathione S-transferase